MPPDSYQTHFVQLLGDLSRGLDCPELAVAPDAHGLTAVDFEIDHVAMTLVYSPDDRPEQLLVVCRFGPLPPHDREAALQRLLEVNYLMAGSAASLGVDAGNGDVVFTLHNALRGVTAVSLAASMSMAARQALHWRETAFLGEPPSPSTHAKARNAPTLRARGLP